MSYEIVKDPIYGYIKIYDHELKIIDTPIFQRLRRIKQTTGVDYVYPCAVHTRFSHSLGVMHVAGIFTQRLLDQINGISEDDKKYYYFLMRLWGLTHDIGHGPYSHIFDEAVLEKYSTDHEEIGARILREYSEFPDKFRIGDLEISREDVAKLIGVKLIEDWPLNSEIGESDVNERILYYIGHGAYSADLIDYIIRDSYFTGAGYGNIDWQRLIYASKPYEDKVILSSRAREAFDALLLARLFMFSAVYYHRTTRAVVKVIKFFLDEACQKMDFEYYIDDIENYAELDEDVILSEPSLRDSKFRKWLIHRKIPYSRVEEQRIPIRIESSDYLDEEILTQVVRSRLPSNLKNALPKEAFFVDTPKLDMNPMFSEEFVYYQMPGHPTPVPKPVLETMFGELPKEFAIVRLYIHDDHIEHKNSIITAFKRKKGRRRTYY